MPVHLYYPSGTIKKSINYTTISKLFFTSISTIREI
jgi:hypothetical protein